MKNFLNVALESNNTVIIPGFGALTITSARTKDIYFIPYLKHDDGTLNKVICDQNGIDKTEAKKFIQEYVELIKKSVDETNFFEIEHFGRFKKLHTGDIEFEKWEEYHKEDTSILAKTIKAKEKAKKEETNTTIIKESPENTIENNDIKSEILDKSVKKEEIVTEEPAIETYVAEIKNKDLEEILGTDEPLKDNNVNEEILNQTEDTQETNFQNEASITFDQNIISEIIEQKENNVENIIDETALENQVNEKVEEEIITKEEIDLKQEQKNKKEIKSKRKKKKEKKESIHTSTEQEEKKKKKAVLPWLLIGIGMASGVIAYTLYSRKNEKIVITEKITHTEDSSKKEIKAEIIKDKELEPVKSNTEKNNSKNSEVKQNNKKEDITKKEIKKQQTIQVKKEVNKTINNVSPSKNTNDKKNIIANKAPENKNKRPTKKELAEADNIVNQLNSNKKNNEAVITIKNNISTNSIKNTTSPTPQQNNSKNTNTTNNNQPDIKNNSTTQQNAVNITKTATTPLSNKPNVNQQAVTNNNKNLTPTTNKTITNQQATNSNNSQTSKNNNSTKPNNQQVTNKPLTGGVAGKKIELIADSYKDKVSAEKLVTKLKDGGYKNARIEEKDGQYNVVIDSYSTLSETMKELRKYRGQ